MSQPAAAALAPLPFELVYSDGEPLDSPWHRSQMNLLIDVIGQGMAERGRDDFFVGGNMFMYYSYEQARDVAAGQPYFRGPDVFYVGGVDGQREQKTWVAWEEEGRLPEVIVELLSPSTAKIDRTVKKDLYARTFHTPEYFLYEPATFRLDGLRLAARSRAYQPIAPNAQGRLWSERLGLELGLWRGVYLKKRATWIRLFRPDGSLVPTEAEAAHRRADAAEERAAAAEAEAAASKAELARLRALLGNR
jgi:Uma2 family endonuclease